MADRANKIELLHCGNVTVIGHYQIGVFEAYVKFKMATYGKLIEIYFS